MINEINNGAQANFKIFEQSSILWDLYPLRTINVPANIYLFKGSTRKKWEIMFKVNYKNTGTTLLKSFYRYYC